MVPDWIMLVGTATVLWSLSDICSDSAIENSKCSEEEKKKSSLSSIEEENGSSKLDGYQGAAVSVSVGCLLGFLLHMMLLGSVQLSAPLILQACFGGGLHFVSYLLLLTAFQRSSSTEITPLLQLSAVWMLPISAADAWSDGTVSMRPLHLLGFLLIVFGGLLPVTAGNVGLLFQKRFWTSSAAGLCLCSEICVAVYSIMLHQNSFDTVHRDYGVTVISAREEPNSIGKNGSSSGNLLVIGSYSLDSGMRSVLTFFILSRYFAFILSCGLYVFVSSYRERIQILWKRKILSSDVSLTSTDPKPVGFLDDSMPQMVHARYKKAVAIKILGDVLSVSGLILGSLAYALFYEPSIVNATEGGLQQLLNLVFAVVLFRLFGIGRPVDHLPVKVVSFMLVLAGLYLSST